MGAPDQGGDAAGRSADLVSSAMGARMGIGAVTLIAIHTWRVK